VEQKEKIASGSVKKHYQHKKKKEVKAKKNAEVFREGHSVHSVAVGLSPRESV